MISHSICPLLFVSIWSFITLYVVSVFSWTASVQHSVTLTPSDYQADGVSVSFGSSCAVSSTDWFLNTNGVS